MKEKETFAAALSPQAGQIHVAACGDLKYWRKGAHYRTRRKAEGCVHAVAAFVP